MAEIVSIIGKRIHQLRRGKNLTQQKLAEAIGVNASYIGPLEKGLKCPSITVLTKLSEVLDQPVYSFFLEDKADGNVGEQAKRLAAILSSHPADEQHFLLRMTEEMSTVLRSRS